MWIGGPWGRHWDCKLRVSRGCVCGSSACNGSGLLLPLALVPASCGSLCGCWLILRGLLLLQEVAAVLLLLVLHVSMLLGVLSRRQQHPPLLLLLLLHVMLL
jgi:hypothetical protein